MLTVANVATIADYIPLFPFDLGVGRNTQYFRKLFITIVMIYFIKEYLPHVIRVTDMYSFTANCVLITSMLSSGYCVWHVFSGMGDRCFIAEKIVEKMCAIIIESPDLSADWLLVAGITFLVGTWAGYTAQCAYFTPASLSAWAWYSAGLILFSTLGHLILVKTVLIEKMMVSRRKLSLDTITQHMSDIRVLLDVNREINRLYAPLASSCVILSAAQTVRCTVNLWLFFGLHSDISYYDPHYLCSCLRYAVKFVLVVLTIHICSKASALVENIKTELDRLVSSQESPLVLRMQIVAVLQELDCFPPDLQCFGIFTLDCALLVRVCGLLVNFTMVVIQCMKK